MFRLLGHIDYSGMTLYRTVSQAPNDMGYRRSFEQRSNGSLAALKSQKVRPPPQFKKTAKAGKSRYHFGASRIDCEVRSREYPLFGNSGHR
jgi:hypothetical protein